MGAVLSTFVGKAEDFGYSATTARLMYFRPLDYDVAGNPKPSIQATWELAMRSMVTVELVTRKLLYPIIASRMKAMKAEATYEQDWITLPKSSQLDESQVMEFHDIFQIFEIEPDGKIAVSDLVIELENFNDRTPLKTRVEIICKHDDGHGHLDFENFLHVMEFLQAPENSDHPLRQTFEKLREINRYLRQMAVTQQVLTGFL